LRLSYALQSELSSQLQEIWKHLILTSTAVISHVVTITVHTTDFKILFIICWEVTMEDREIEARGRWKKDGIVESVLWQIQREAYGELLQAL
jgi:hypothetical protein